MQGRGAKGSIKDRLMQNRFIRYYRKRKLKKKLLQEKKKKQQKLEAQKRMAFVYHELNQDSLPKLPKRFVVIRKSLANTKRKVTLPKDVPLLVEVFYEKKVGIESSISKKEKIVCQSLQDKVAHLEQTALSFYKEKANCSFTSEEWEEMVQSIEQELLIIKANKKDLEKEYQAFLLQYSSSKDEFLIKIRKIYPEKLKRIEQLCDSIEAVITNKKERWNQVKLVENAKEEAEKKKEEQNRKKDILCSKEKTKTPQKRPPIMIFPLALKQSASFQMYRNRVFQLKEAEQSLSGKLKEQEAYLKSIYNQVGKVNIAIQKKEAQMKGIHHYLKRVLRRAILYLFTPFQPKRKKIVYTQMKEINQNIHSLRKMIHTDYKISVAYQDNTKELNSFQNSIQEISDVVQDSLKEITLLKAELQEEFKALTAKKEYQTIFHSILFLEQSLKEKEQEIKHSNQLANQVLLENKKKIKRMEEYRK